MGKDEFDRWEETRRQRRAERKERRRGRDAERKEHVLHTRISDQLDDALRRASDELRVPVSNLVRNVLEDVFSVVEKVTENVGDLLDDLMDEAGRVRSEHSGRRSRRTPSAAADEPAAAAPPAPEFPEIVGFQPVVLNGGKECATCGMELTRGLRAFMGIDEGGTPIAYLCRDCLEQRR